MYLVGFVFMEVAVEEGPLAITFASEDMGANLVEEPAIMRDDQRGTGEFEQRIF